jgi:transposase InsO family protein
MSEHKLNWPAAVMCDVLKVSRSGYYDWQRRKDAPPSPREEKRQKRAAAIDEAFKASRGIYGYRKIHAALRRQGIDCSPNTVRADCKRAGIKSITRRKYRVKTTDSNHDKPIAKNVLNRDFTASNPNEKWLTDITYVATLQGWLYVVVILDIFSRKIVGYAMADHMRAELVVSAFKMALQRGRKFAGEIWLHSDRGVQFASEELRAALRLAGVAQSMSGKGDCWDNAPCESWFGKLKSEWIYPHEIFETHTEAELKIVEYIEMFYNSERLHQALDYQTPNEFEANYFASPFELAAR